MVEQNYVSYQVDRPEASCTFLRPTDWEVRETMKDGTTDIFIAGPRNRAGTFATSLTVKVSSAHGQTPEEAAADLLSRYRALSSFQELGRASGMVAGYPAVEVEFAYSMPLPPNSIDPQWTAIRQRRIFLKRGDQLYELRYAAPEEEYETRLEAFRTLVQSLTFSKESVSRVPYQPVILAAPQYVREESPEYEAKKSQDDGKSEQRQS